MQSLKIAENIVPLSDFKARAAQWFEKIAAGDPVVITQNGRAAGVLLSPATYDSLIQQLAFLESVAKGIRDIESGQTVSHAQMVAETKARYGKPSEK